MEEKEYMILSILFLIILCIIVLAIGFVVGRNSVNTYDTNQDGKVDVCDAVTIIRYLRGEEV